MLVPEDYFPKVIQGSPGAFIPGPKEKKEAEEPEAPKYVQGSSGVALDEHEDDSTDKG